MKENSTDTQDNPYSKVGLSWIAIGSGLAGLSVMLGAFGAHSLKARLTEKNLATFHTATAVSYTHLTLLTKA